MLRCCMTGIILLFIHLVERSPVLRTGALHQSASIYLLVFCLLGVQGYSGPTETASVWFLWRSWLVGVPVGEVDSLEARKPASTDSPVINLRVHGLMSQEGLPTSRFVQESACRGIYSDAFRLHSEPQCFLVGPLRHRDSHSAGISTLGIERQGKSQGSSGLCGRRSEYLCLASSRNTFAINKCSATNGP